VLEYIFCNLYTRNYIECRHSSHIQLINLLIAHKRTHRCTSKVKLFGRPKQ